MRKRGGQALGASKSESGRDRTFDGLGSVAAVTDPSGNVAASYQYDPYGNVTSQTGSLYNPFQYASGWQSDITNFTHFGQRWYAPLPEYGRWTQQDPVAGSLFHPTSQCRYTYANDDPVNLTDMSGRQSLGLCITLYVVAAAGIIGGLIGIGIGVASLFLAPPTGGLSLLVAFGAIGIGITGLIAGVAAYVGATLSGC